MNETKKAWRVKTYHEQRFPFTLPVRVTWADGMTHEDEVKGLNAGHALHRARWNWPDAVKVEVIIDAEQEEE